MKMTVETAVKAKLNTVWDTWNNPEDIMQWNAPQNDWHTTSSAVDLREGGKFKARMEAKDGSEGFDFEGVYTRIVPKKQIEYRMTRRPRGQGRVHREQRQRYREGDVRYRKHVHPRASAPGLAEHHGQLRPARGSQALTRLQTFAGQLTGLLQPSGELGFVEPVVLVDVEVTHFLVLGLAGREGTQ